MSPLLDLLITFLYIGRDRLKSMYQERKDLSKVMRKKFSALAQKYGERVLNIPKNTISMAMSLSATLESDAETQLGATLFRKRVSGLRVVARGGTKTIAPYTFHGWGASVKAFPTSYITAACAVGTTEKDIDEFLKRLDKCLKDMQKKKNKIKKISDDISGDVDEKNI